MKTSRFFPQLFFAALLASLKPTDLPTVQPYRGMNVGGYNPIFTPRKSKFKGWMRENRKCSFNKTK